jgi:ribosome-associated protein YbcJ (S4-like RNA binding protein)
MTTANVVFSGPARNVQPITREAKIATGETILPGHLVILNAGEWDGVTTQGGAAGFCIADMNVIEQKTVTDALTVGGNAKAFVPEVGATYNLVLADGETIILGSPLTSSATAGEVEIAIVTGATPDQVLFIAEEAITTSGSTARIRARHVASGVSATA